MQLVEQSGLDAVFAQEETGLLCSVERQAQGGELARALQKTLLLVVAAQADEDAALWNMPAGGKDGLEIRLLDVRAKAGYFSCGGHFDVQDRISAG